MIHWRLLLRGLAASLALFGPSTAWAQTQLARQEVRPGVFIDVSELRRLAGTEAVQLRFTVDNRSADAVDLEQLNIANTYEMTDLQLLDLKNSRAYYIGSAGNQRLASKFDDTGAVDPGQRRDFWAWFAAPAGGVSSLAVFLPGSPPILEVPLAK